MKRTKKVIIGGAMLASLVAIAGVAYAAWSSNAMGSGRATAQTAVNATLNPVDGEADLYPGTTDGDAYFTITNNNDYPITYTAMTSGTVTSSDNLACPSTNVTVDGATMSLLAPANTTTATLSIDDVVNMDAAAPDGCQGQTFDVVLTLTGTQSA